MPLLGKCMKKKKLTLFILANHLLTCNDRYIEINEYDVVKLAVFFFVVVWSNQSPKCVQFIDLIIYFICVVVVGENLL